MIQKFCDFQTINDAYNEGYDIGYWAGHRDFEPKWIPCSERLPEESGEYLVTIGPMLYFSWFYKDDDMWSFKHADITAWMPLPEPYKEGEEE